MWRCGAAAPFVSPGGGKENFGAVQPTIKLSSSYFILFSFFLQLTMIGNNFFLALHGHPDPDARPLFYLLFFLFLVVVVAMAWFLLLQQRGCCLWC